MKLAVLFSGGKDSTLAAYIAKTEGYELSCLVSVVSQNKYSYMFHTPSIEKTKKQAEIMGLPIIIQKTKGEKEKELQDLKKAVSKAKEKYGIQGIITGAVESVYQSTRIQKICKELEIECFNPLWQKNQEEILNDLIKNNFEVILVGVFAYPLNQTWLGKKINKEFIKETKKLQEKYGFNMAGEGGEYESFVLNCPLFKEKIDITSHEDFGEQNSWRREINTEQKTI